MKYNMGLEVESRDPIHRGDPRVSLNFQFQKPGSPNLKTQTVQVLRVRVQELELSLSEF